MFANGRTGKPTRRSSARTLHLQVAGFTASTGNAESVGRPFARLPLSLIDSRITNDAARTMYSFIERGWRSSETRCWNDRPMPCNHFGRKIWPRRRKKRSRMRLLGNGTNESMSNDGIAGWPGVLNEKKKREWRKGDDRRSKGCLRRTKRWEKGGRGEIAGVKEYGRRRGRLIDEKGADGFEKQKG